MIKSMHVAARGGNFGNGRAVRNLLEKAKRRQALRLQMRPGKKAKEDLVQLTAEDFDEKDITAVSIQRSPGKTGNFAPSREHHPLGHPQ